MTEAKSVQSWLSPRSAGWQMRRAYAWSYLVSAAIHVAALPCLAMGRRENTASDAIDAPESEKAA
jgi:hypothetical protein